MLKYKTTNKVNPEFMNIFFKGKENQQLVREQYKLNLEWNKFFFLF